MVQIRQESILIASCITRFSLSLLSCLRNNYRLFPISNQIIRARWLSVTKILIKNTPYVVVIMIHRAT